MTHVIKAPKVVAPPYLEWLRRDRMGGVLVDGGENSNINMSTEDTDFTDGVVFIRGNGVPETANKLTLSLRKPTHFAQYSLYFNIGFKEIEFVSDGGYAIFNGMPKRALASDLFIIQFTPFNGTWDMQSYSASPYAYIFRVPPEGMTLQEAPYHRTCYRYTGATPVTIKVPKTSTPWLRMGYFVEFIKQAGDGAVTIEGEDASVTINAPSSGLTLPGKGSRCSLMYVGNGEWDMAIIPGTH